MALKMKVALKAKALDTSNMPALLRGIYNKVLRSGKEVFESVIQKGETAVKTAPKPQAKAPLPQVWNDKSVVSKLLPARTAQNTLAAQLRRKAALQV